ncbi:glycosyltransferase family 2 protein [Mucilaginibacter sp. AW1-7]|uniref:glycosyltransferase family 2 protein n=1 Tax=Mucilaginibacter sp. AW1-7 TaxID=3349874 RepID=UPI003F73521A
MKLPIAIVIPTFNRKHLLIQCLELLRTQTVKPELTIVVDDGSSDGTGEILSRDFPEVICLKGDGNLWWTGSVNLGIDYVLKSHPAIEAIILQNDDVNFKSDWIENLVTVAKENPKALIGSATVDVADGDTITYAGKTTHPWFAYSKYYHRGAKLSSLKEDLLIESFDLIGRGIYIPVEVFQSTGLFDYEHFKHRGDTELPLRAKNAGYKLLVTSRAIVMEYTGTTASVDIKEKYSLNDIKSKFFDFRSSAYWKYRYYYGKILSKNNPVQHHFFFVCRMFIHLGGFVSRLRLW